MAESQNITGQSGPLDASGGPGKGEPPLETGGAPSPEPGDPPPSDEPGDPPPSDEPGDPPPSDERPTGVRWLCSELVTIHWNHPGGFERSQVANIEEIWREGAALDAEEPLAEGILARLIPHAGDGDDPPASSLASFARSRPVERMPELRPPELRAVVRSCRQSATGYAIEVAFSAGSEWSPSAFPPSHAVNPIELKASAGGAASPEIRSSVAAGSSSEGDASAAARRSAVSQTIELGSLYCLARRATGD